MKMILSKRLSAIAYFVKKGDRVADIGTDHGYIPIWLVQNNVSPFVIASDVNPSPLNRAIASASAHQVEDKIKFVLSDGLDFISETEIDVVLIAGMGGENIADILSRAAWAADGIHRLILQPMSKSDYLIRFLWDKGYKIDDASLVEENSTLYIVLSVSGGRASEPNPAEFHVPRKLIEKNDPLLKKYIRHLKRRNTRALEGLTVSQSEKGERLTEIRLLISELERMERNLYDKSNRCIWRLK